MTGVNEGHDIRSESRRKDIYLIGTTSDDQDFIAHSRQDIPPLLDFISELKMEIEKIKNGG